MTRLEEIVRFDDRGLVAAVAQDRLTGRVLMVAWMTREALERTLATRLATFWSRSRGALWTKGESSGNVLEVRDVRVDCDGDTVLLLVDPKGPTCHTGEATCFFGAVEGEEVVHARPAAALLEELESEIESRKASDAASSYTRSLLDGGAPKIGAKLREEASELAQAIGGESEHRVAAEAADVLYHLMVALSSRGVLLRDVLEELARRRGKSGHQEKASRQGR